MLIVCTKHAQQLGILCYTKDNIFTTCITPAHANVMVIFNITVCPYMDMQRHVRFSVYDKLRACDYESIVK